MIKKYKKCINIVLNGILRVYKNKKLSKVNLIKKYFNQEIFYFKNIVK